MYRPFAFSIAIALTITFATERASACRFHRWRCNCAPYLPAITVVPALVPQKLTVEAARDALAEMVAKEGPVVEDRDKEVKALKSGKSVVVMEKDAEGILVGYWNCDLETKRFWFKVPVGFSLYSYRGDFEYTNGRWIAKITSSSRASLGPRSFP